MTRWLFLILGFLASDAEAKRINASYGDDVAGSSSGVAQPAGTKETRLQETSNLVDPLSNSDVEGELEPFIFPLHDVTSDSKGMNASNGDDVAGSSSGVAQPAGTKETRLQETSNLLDPLPNSDVEGDPEPFILPLHDVNSPPGGSMKRLDQKKTEPVSFPNAKDKSWWENWWNWLFAGVDL